MAETKKWSFEDRKRWKIRAILESKTPLHIGNGETLDETEFVIDKETKDNANAFIKDSQGKPIIPGSTLKGKIRSFLQNQENLDKQLLNQVFGENTNEESQGSGGLAIFHDAMLANERDEKQQEAYIKGVEHYPDWNIDRNTYLEASTAINRHTLTAKDGSLHYQECVPPATQFELIITGDMNEAQLEFLLSVLEALTSQKIAIGAEDSNGKGLMQKIYEHDVSYLDHQTIRNWLKEQPRSRMASTYMQKLDKDKVREMQRKYTFSSRADAQNYHIRLDFCSPFIVNDPNKTGKKGEPSQQALTDALGNPLLPAKSFRGALRSQAERIIRTLGGHCCDTESPCKDTPQRCIACEMFGGIGWKSNISVTDFNYVSETNNKASKETQQFVAIDRFHGGGKDTALFSSEYFPSPSLNGKLSLSLRQGSNSPDDYAWQKGLLALLFRDLQESDIQFGFGKNKGFGKLAKIIIESGKDQINDSSSDRTDKNLEALRKKIRDNFVEYSCQSSVTPVSQDHRKLKSITAGVAANGQFHNPYHFIPVKNPIYEWEETDRSHNRAIKTKSHHSHAFYRDKTENGNPLYNGRFRCKITSQTPFFIGKAEDATINQSEDNQASLKSPYRRDGNLAIPATSLRGMISSIVEIASNSALREMDLETALSYRKKADPKQALSSLGFIIEDKETRELKLLPVTQLGLSKILLKKAYSDADMKAFIEANDSWSCGKNTIFYLDKELIETGKFDIKFTKYPPTTLEINQSVPGVLRILGKFGSRVDDMTAKNNEYFIPIPDHVSDLSEYLSQQFSRAKPIANEAIKTFNALVDQRIKSQNAKREKGDLNINSALPFMPKGDTRALDGNVRLRHGDIVFYRDDAQGQQITEVSFSAIWRGKVKNDLKDFLYKDLLPFSPARDTLSPAELLFGFIEKQQDKPIKNALSFAGKINIGVGQLSQAFANKNDTELLDAEVMLKELSAPKPPSPALYFKVKNNGNADNAKNAHIEKAELNAQQHTIQGRKIYLHALLQDKGDVQKLGTNGEAVNNNQAKYPWETQHPEDIDAQKRKVRITPIKSGVSFEFDVTFNNLTEWELGLMCYSLKPDNDFCHKLGMGKPIGLGSVKIDIEALELIDRKQRYEKDTLNDARYNKASPDINNLKKAFIKTMSPDIYQVLCLVGNPENIKNPVHYPQVTGEDIEDKSYQWFVANDIGSGSDRNKIEAMKNALQAINENSTRLPTLKRYQWNG